jgi:REP element-mobilizing transposase RayT
MPRRLRIEYAGAIYPVMARGNARQKIVRDDADRGRMIEVLKQTVNRCGWELASYVVMGNHLNLLVKTARPKPGVGMQSFLSGHAILEGRRWRRQGHLVQGRNRTEMTARVYFPVDPAGRGWYSDHGSLSNAPDGPSTRPAVGHSAAYNWKD